MGCAVFAGRLLWLESVKSDLDSWWCVCCGKLTQHLTVAWVSSVDVKYTLQKSRPYLPNSMNICVFVVAHATHGLRNRASSQIRSNCDKTCLPQGSVYRSISSRRVYTYNHMQPSLGGSCCKWEIHISCCLRGKAMKCEETGQVLQTVLMAYPGQASSLQGSHGADCDTLAVNNLGTGSGWRQSRQNLVLLAVAGT